MSTEIPRWLTSNFSPEQGSFRKFGNQLVQALCETRVAFHDYEADKPTSLGSVQRLLQQQISMAVSGLMADLVTPSHDSTTRQACAAEVQQIREYSPSIMKAILDKSLIKEMGPEDPQAIIATAIALARQPAELADQVVIRTGFGGSEATDVPLRSPAYTLPAVKVWENLDSVLESIGVTQRPTINLFWACHAAININGMDPEAVLTTAQRSITYIDAYLQRFHPKTAQYVKYAIDNPWNEHDPNTQILIEYLVELLNNNSEDDAFLTNSHAWLARRAQNHGAQDHSLYTALHPIFFGDPLPVRHNYFSDSNDSLFNITIGGPPERDFNKARRHLVSRASIEGLQALATAHNLTIDPSCIKLTSLPITTRLICHTGRAPVYYSQQNEPTLSMTAPGIMDGWQETVQHLGSNLTGSERSIALTQAQGITHDLQTLIDDCGGEENFINLTNEFSLSKL